MFGRRVEVIYGKDGLFKRVCRSRPLVTGVVACSDNVWADHSGVQWDAEAVIFNFCGSFYMKIDLCRTSESFGAYVEYSEGSEAGDDDC